MRMKLDVRVSPRSLALLAGGTAAGALALQASHLRRLSTDPEYRRLRSLPPGRPLRVLSPDGTRIHAEAFGPEDGSLVVLAHGWTERIGYWGPVISELTRRGLRVMAYDLRGHGDSALAAGDDYSLERFGEDLEAVLAASLAEGELAAVAGHSLGGMAIAAWAEHHEVGRRACATVLLNTGFSRLIAETQLLPAMSWLLTEPIARRLFLGSRASIPTFSTPLQHAVIRYAAFGPSAGPGEVGFYERMLMACPPHVRAACGLAMSDMDLQHAVERLTAPTLILTGSRDRLTPPGHAERIAEALPRPEGVIELPETGHMSPLERPVEVAGAIADMARRHAPAVATPSA